MINSLNKKNTKKQVENLFVECFRLKTMKKNGDQRNSVKIKQKSCMTTTEFYTMITFTGRQSEGSLIRGFDSLRVR